MDPIQSLAPSIWNTLWRMLTVAALKVFGNSNVLASLGWLLLIVFPLINGQCLLILHMFTCILDPFTCLFYQPRVWLPSPQSLCGQRWMVHLQTSRHDSDSKNEKGRCWTKDASSRGSAHWLLLICPQPLPSAREAGKCSLPVSLSARCLTEGEKKNGYWVDNQSLPHPYALLTLIRHFGGASTT